MSLGEEERAFLNRLRGEYAAKANVVLTDQEIIRAAIRNFMDAMQWQPSAELQTVQKFRDLLTKLKVMDRDQTPATKSYAEKAGV